MPTTATQQLADRTPITEALRRMADLMDADDRRGQLQTTSSLILTAFYASYGVTSEAEWDAENDRLRKVSHQQRMAWWKACRPVHRAVSDLLFPRGFQSPPITPAGVRALADQLTREGTAE